MVKAISLFSPDETIVFFKRYREISWVNNPKENIKGFEPDLTHQRTYKTRAKVEHNVFCTQTT
jgi:hypothetical protein